MKKQIFVLLLSTISFMAFSQDLAYEIRGKYTHPVKKETLAEANQLSDFIEGYPTSWVKDYVSVEILTNENGISQKAIGQNEKLNADQKNMLDKINLSSDLEIKVAYKYPNAVTEQIENRNMLLKMTVVPEVEAEYLGGYKVLKQFLKAQLDLLVEKTPTEFQNGKVAFTIDEQGAVTNAATDVSSGNTKTDELLLEIINKMPKWKPAQNAKGEKVKQSFVFSMGIGGC